MVAAPSTTKERTGNVVGLGIGAGAQSRPRVGQPRSILSDNGSLRGPSPLVRSPGHSDSGHSQVDGVDSRFFHASDATKQEPVVRKPEPKKPSVFFHADGSREAQLAAARAPPVATPIKRYSNPWPHQEPEQEKITSPPPLLSPTLSSVSMSSSPFFAPLPPTSDSRAASPSKENIHLSYRRGASQIFGLRPSPIPASRSTVGSIAEQQSPNDQRRVSLELKPYQTPHRKSTSLSSIDSGSSIHSRRRSATTLDPSANASSPLSQEANFNDFPRISKQLVALPSIGASLEHGEDGGGNPNADGPLSPSKSVSELAADARRERKVLDLEISNSSLLAINSSLEREVRRQKAELKRFRRLSRAGKFGFAPHERTARLSEGLSVLGEENEDDEDFDFGSSGLRDAEDDFSEDDDDDETESVTSGGEPLSPSARESKEEARLAKDELRLRADISKHKELLVQSQMMNQSLKRCMYATEEMINEGKKALQYNVRVSDIRLGGRILTDHDDDEHDDDHHDYREDHRDDSVPDTELEDDTLQGADMHARGFLDVWSSLGGGSFEGSEGGDRDSGIEVDKLPHTSAPLSGYRIAQADNGRPPETEHWQQRR